MGNVLLVVSGKGGTGKTTVTSGIACALAVAGKRVLAIDADSGMRNLDISLGMMGDTVYSFADVARNDIPIEDAAAQNRAIAGLYMLTAPSENNYHTLTVSNIRGLIKQASDSFDWTVIDCPAGVGEAVSLFAPFCTHGAVVITLEASAVRCAEIAACRLNELNVENTRLVVNRVRREPVNQSKGAVDEAMDYVGLPLLGLVPEDFGIAKAAAVGKSIFSSCSVRSYNAFRNMAYRLEGKNVPLLKF